MAISMLMPRQGETVESCLILKWKKKEGDKVDVHESICEVETNKAVFEIEAPEKGIILKIITSFNLSKAPAPLITLEIKLPVL